MFGRFVVVTRAVQFANHYYCISTILRYIQLCRVDAVQVGAAQLFDVVVVVYRCSGW